MVKVACQGYMDAVGVPAVVLQEGEVVQKLLGWMLVLAVPCVDECRCGGKAVPLCIPAAVLFQPAAEPLLPAPYYEDLVVVARQGVEGVGKAFLLVDGRMGCVQVGKLDPVEFSRILEGFLGPCAVLDKDLVDTEVGVVYPEPVHSSLVIRFYIALELPCLLEKIHFLVEREIINDSKTSTFECVHTYIIKRKG